MGFGPAIMETAYFSTTIQQYCTPCPAHGDGVLEYYNTTILHSLPCSWRRRTAVLQTAVPYWTGRLCTSWPAKKSGRSVKRKKNSNADVMYIHDTVSECRISECRISECRISECRICKRRAESVNAESLRTLNQPMPKVCEHRISERRKSQTVFSCIIVSSVVQSSVVRS